MRNSIQNKGVNLALLSLVTLPLMSIQQKSGAKTPNVLFIAIDDLRPELNCYESSHIKSPNINRLASQGVLFEKAYVQQAISMASRSSLLTGYRPESHGLYTGESVVKLIPEALTINKHFENNDYSISAYGKIYHYGSDHRAQFGKRHMDPMENWAGRGYLTSESIKKMKENEALDPEQYKGRGPAFEFADVPDSAYIDGYNTEYALRELRKLKKEGKPFFMSVGFHKPHLPFVAPKKYLDMYPIERIGLSELQKAPKNSNKYTLRGWGELRNYHGIPKNSDPVGKDTTLLLRQGYFACVSYVDALVGKLLDELKQLDLDKNTIIVLWGDHGYKLGDYGTYWGKWSNMNIDTRIPLIISVPGGKKGVRSNVPVETVDLYPTLAALCGLEIPKHVEGKSIVSLLKNPTQKLDYYAYSVWPHNRDKYDKVVMGYAVKSSRYNYVEWVQLNTGEVLERELYDHQLDPMETVNVINESKYADVIKLLVEKCKVRKDATHHNHALR